MRTRQTVPGDFIRRPSRDVVIGKDDVSPVGLENPVDQVKQRGLAGAVGSNESDNFAFPDPKLTTVYRKQASKPFAYARTRAECSFQHPPGTRQQAIEAAHQPFRCEEDDDQ